MNIEFIRDKWIPALRSGEYTQTQNRLTDGVGFCCLGVACDVIAREQLVEGVTWHAVWNEDGELRHEPIDDPRAVTNPLSIRLVSKRGQSDGALTVDLARFIGITSFGHIRDNTPGPDGEKYGTTSLTRLNDVNRLTFDEIADLLERQVNGEDIFRSYGEDLDEDV